MPTGRPDIVEQGRGTARRRFGQRFGGLTIRLDLENLTDEDYLFTQTLTAGETQRLYKLGRTLSVAFGYNVF